MIVVGITVTVGAVTVRTVVPPACVMVDRTVDVVGWSTVVVMVPLGNVEVTTPVSMMVVPPSTLYR